MTATYFPERRWIYDLVDELPGAHAADQPAWDAVVAWIGDRMFALVSRHPDGRALLTLKLPPGQGDALRAVHAWIEPGYHLNKRHWNSLALDHPEADDATVAALVEDSYECLLGLLPRWRQEEIRTGVPRP